MRHPPLAAGWIDRPHRERSIGALPLERGGRIDDCRLVWVEHGERRAGNTILALTAIGSTHHRLDFLIGPGRALDTTRFHVVVVDALGNGLSSSPSNTPSQADAAFPRITIRDMVESQRRLLDALGIDALYAVVGASMGGMQALQWAASHPARVGRLVAMTAMAKTAPWSQLMNELSRRALFADEAFTRPRSREEAMRLWAPLTQLVTASSPEAAERFADVEALLAEIAALERHLGEHGPQPFDWLCQTRAYDAHDIGDVTRIGLPALLLATMTDLYNPVESTFVMGVEMPRASVVIIPSARGHRAATDTHADDAAFLNRAIGGFLA